MTHALHLTEPVDPGILAPPSASPTPVVSVSPTPVRSPAPGGTTLPQTGPDATFLIIVGVALVALGVVVLSALARVRRRAARY